MPVEINELVIRATVSNDSNQQQAALPVTDNTQKMQQIIDAFLNKMDKKKER